ncbi:MAG: redoxin domain-containing protein [Candidatus Hydrogenedentes bacterium]|nr:redoxin domain-containing protein [Candidatus Hydrogenedentota bacterium]
MQKSRSAGWPVTMVIPAILSLSIALLGVAASAAPAESGQKPAASATAPKPAPAPVVTLVKANQLKEALTKAKGKVVVLNFWGTYCPPCVAEMPEFTAFYKSYQGKDVELLSINCDDPADANTTVKEFIVSKKIPFPVSTLDGFPDEVSKFLGTVWDGRLPATYIYDSTGKLVKTIEDETTAKELSALVDPLLPKKSPAK